MIALVVKQMFTFRRMPSIGSDLCIFPDIVLFGDAGSAGSWITAKFVVETRRNPKVFKMYMDL